MTITTRPRRSRIFINWKVFTTSRVGGVKVFTIYTDREKIEVKDIDEQAASYSSFNKRTTKLTRVNDTKFTDVF